MTKKPWPPLKRLRMLQQLTQREVADALGVTQDTVANWESGRSVPKLTVPQFKILLKVLQVTAEELPDNFGPPSLLDEEVATTSVKEN
jgi:transcriptional regulator with XRE-family HTH domain